MTDERQIETKKQLSSPSGNGIGVGVAIGAAFGAAYGASSGAMGQSLAIGVALGTAIGAIFNFTQRRKSKPKNDDGTPLVPDNKAVNRSRRSRGL